MRVLLVAPFNPDGRDALHPRAPAPAGDSHHDVIDQ